MTQLAYRLIVLTTLIFLAPQSLAWTLAGGLFVSPLGIKAEATTVGSSAPEEFDTLDVFADVREEGTTVDADDNSCNDTGSGIICSVDAKTTNLSSLCEYCGSGSGLPEEDGEFQPTKDWGVNPIACQIYTPPGGQR